MNGHEMLPDVGKENRTISTTTQSRAIQATGREIAAQAPDALLEPVDVVAPR